MLSENSILEANRYISDQKEYLDVLQSIKKKVIDSRLHAAKSVNKVLIELYFYIGKIIVEKQELSGWGKSVVEMLSKDLKFTFPEMTGFSPQNLWIARKFYLEYGDSIILQQLVVEIPWGHNVLIMQKTQKKF